MIAQETAACLSPIEKSQFLTDRDVAENVLSGRARQNRPHPASADFEHMADLSLAARGGLTASLGAFDLSLADVREHGAEMLVLDNGCLGNLPKLVETGVRQVKPAVADRQPAVRIIDDGHPLAAQLTRDLVRLQQKHDLMGWTPPAFRRR